MTRNLNIMGVAAAMAMMGGGYGPRIAQASDGRDDEETRLKREALEEGCRREREDMRLAAEKQVAERRRRIADDNARQRADFDKLRAGIDPTNDRPLSRQQRRALNRRNFPFIDNPELGQGPSYDY